MQLGVITPICAAGANASPPAVSSTYGAPAPTASSSAPGQRNAPSPLRTKSGSVRSPAVAKRRAVTSHALSVWLAIDSLVIAGKPAHIKAASTP
jgi:hypothetical protein